MAAGITEEMFEKIIDKIIEGMSVKKICSLPGFCSQSAFYVALEQNKNFQERYVQAKMIDAHIKNDEIIEIADDLSRDEYDRNAVNRARLRIDARKWSMSKAHPKKYGNNIEIESGEDSKITVNVVKFGNKDEE